MAERDPLLYVALTRATFGVVFVEPDVAFFSQHYPLHGLLSQRGIGSGVAAVEVVASSYASAPCASVALGSESSQAGADAKVQLQRTVFLGDEKRALPGPAELRQVSSLVVTVRGKFKTALQQWKQHLYHSVFGCPFCIMYEICFL